MKIDDTVTIIAGRVTEEGRLTTVILLFSGIFGEREIAFDVAHKNNDMMMAGREVFRLICDAVEIPQPDDTAAFVGKALTYFDFLHIEKKAQLAKRGFFKAENVVKYGEFDDRYVYVISCLGSSPEICKIGIAANPDRRLKELSTASPFTLQVEYTRRTNAARAIELAAHENFAGKRRNGEWFNLSSREAIDFVNATISSNVMAA